MLLPASDGVTQEEARAEYASVASFGELALELLALGAPVDLVRRCHQAATEEIGHAVSIEALHGRAAAAFGPMPLLLRRRIGGSRRRRRALLVRLAVESYRDGWLNEGAAATELEERARAAATDAERAVWQRMADEERSHAELARDIVLWCHSQNEDAVGRALAAA